MKYKDLDKKVVKEICKAHGYKQNGKPRFECDKCPLRRTRQQRTGAGMVEKVLFCYYVLMNLYDDAIEEFIKLRDEEVEHPEEVEKFIKERFDTVD